MLAKYGRGSISLQSPVTYQFEIECKRSFEFVTRKDLPLFFFDIVAIATNGNSLLKRSSSHSPVLQQATILLVVLSANGDGSASTPLGKFQGQFTK